MLCTAAHLSQYFGERVWRVQTNCSCCLYRCCFVQMACRGVHLQCCGVNLLMWHDKACRNTHYMACIGTVDSSSCAACVCRQICCDCLLSVYSRREQLPAVCLMLAACAAGLCATAMCMNCVRAAAADQL